MGRYTQVFTLTYRVDPDDVWLALQHAVDDMDGVKLERVDDSTKKLEFLTGRTWRSQGQLVDARVEAAPGGGSEIHVRSKPMHMLWLGHHEAAAFKLTRFLNKNIKKEIEGK